MKIVGYIAGAVWVVCDVARSHWKRAIRRLRTTMGEP